MSGKNARFEKDKIMKTVLVIAVLIYFPGCTYRGAYEGLLSSSRIECSKVPGSEYDDCLEKANRPYDEYERERKAVTGRK